MARIKYEPVACYHCDNMINDPIEYVKKPLPLNTKEGVVMIDRELHNECAIDLGKKMHYEIGSKEEDDDFDKVYKLFKVWYGLDPDNTKQHLDKYTIMRLKGLRVGDFFSTGQNVKYLKKGYSANVIHKTMLFVTDTVLRALAGKVKDQPRRSQTNYIMAIILNNINMIDSRVQASQRARESIQKIDETAFDDSESVYVKKHSGKTKLQQAFVSINENTEDDLDDFSDIL